MHLLTSFVVLVILTHRNAEGGLHCLSCNEVPTPHSCTHLTLCGDHESCFTESIISTSGTVLYNVGCMSKSKCAASHATKRDVIVTCIECCNADFCNIQGCGISAVPREKRGPYCYHCEVQDRQNSCQDVSICGLDEACILEPSLDHLPDTYYKSRCGQKSMCLQAQHIHNNGQSTPNPAAVIIGKRYGAFGDCPACCYTDFCNNNCTQNNSVAIHGITQITGSFTITNAPVATLTSAKPTSATTHLALTEATKLVTDVHQHHASTSMPSTTQATTKPTLTATDALLTEATHLGTYVHHEKTSTHVPLITNATQDCSQYGDGYIQTRHLCIKFHFEAVNFKDAATNCSKEGAMLVTIDTEHKMREIWNELHKISVDVEDLWTGGSDVNNTDTFYWQNGVEVRHHYTNWGKYPQQPEDPHYHDQDCIILHKLDNYTWYDEPCNRVYGFICEHPMPAIHTSTHQTTSCESQDGFHQLENNLGCIMDVQASVDWQSANNYCRSHQSHLVSINSQNKQDAIHRFLIKNGANNDPWIGLFSTLTPPHHLHHWRWESGLPYSYNNWAVDQPEGPGTCVVMHTGGRWRNKICSSHHSFICQKY